MTISIQKCSVQHFGVNNPKHRYRIGDHVLSETVTMKDLGFLIKNDLSFKEHTRKVSLSGQRMVSMLFRSFFSNDHKLLTNAFKCYIRPILESSTVVWNPTDVACSNVIEKVQRSFTKRLLYRCGLQYITYKDRLEMFGLDTLEHRRNLSDITFLHKCIHDHFIFDKDNLYRISPLERLLRNSHSLRITIPFQMMNTTSTFASRQINLWNTLPQDKVTLSPESFAKFVRSLSPASITPVSLLRWNHSRTNPISPIVRRTSVNKKIPPSLISTLCCRFCLWQNKE